MPTTRLVPAHRDSVCRVRVQARVCLVMCMCVCAGVCRHVCACAHVCMCVCMCTCVCAYVCACAGVCARVCVRVCSPHGLGAGAHLTPELLPAFPSPPEVGRAQGLWSPLAGTEPALPAGWSSPFPAPVSLVSRLSSGSSHLQQPPGWGTGEGGVPRSSSQRDC